MLPAVPAAAGQSNVDFAAADKLFWEILKFLWSCPNHGHEHPYRMKHIRGVQENVLEAISTNQMIILRDESGAIEHFISYWFISPEDVEGLKNNIKPAVRWQGDMLYISEHGNKGGRRSLTKMIQAIREIYPGKGVLWHGWNRHTFRIFKQQKGEVA